MEIEDVLSYERLMRQRKLMVWVVVNDSSEIVWSGDPNSDSLEFPPAYKNQPQYETLETGGFIYLYYKPFGRLYWFAQALERHKFVDLKIHVSVIDEDLATAWNVLAALFIRKRCLSGMKIQTQDSEWPNRQNGREITIYIYRYSPAYDAHFDAQLNTSLEQDRKFWLDLVGEAEDLLSRAAVRSKGTAKGDLALGRYTSIRNEAFVKPLQHWNVPITWTGMDAGVAFEDQWIYPNDAGWNAAQHAEALSLLPTHMWFHQVIVQSLVKIWHGVCLLLNEIE